MTPEHGCKSSLTFLYVLNLYYKQCGVSFKAALRKTEKLFGESFK